jgi:hypothetical protein
MVPSQPSHRPTTDRHARVNRSTIAFLAVVAFLFAGCIHATEPNADRKARDVAALAAVLPLIDELGVSEWRDDDWCRDFVYDRGHFMTSDEPDDCNPMGGPPEPFNANAQADFDRVAAAFRDAHVPIREIYRPPVDPGTTDFDLRAGSFDGFSYVHDPGYPPQENIENEWVATPIDANWYFVWEDWN